MRQTAVGRVLKEKQTQPANVNLSRGKDGPLDKDTQRKPFFLTSSDKHLKETGLECRQRHVCTVCVCARACPQFETPGWTSFISQPQARLGVHTPALRLVTHSRDNCDYTTHLSLGEAADAVSMAFTSSTAITSAVCTQKG